MKRIPLHKFWFMLGIVMLRLPCFAETPTLLVLPPEYINVQKSIDPKTREKWESAMRLGATQAETHTVWTREEMLRYWKVGVFPKTCFSWECLNKIANHLSPDYFLAGQITRMDSLQRLRLLLFDVKKRVVIRALEKTGSIKSFYLKDTLCDPLIPFAQNATQEILDKGNMDSLSENAQNYTWTKAPLPKNGKLSYGIIGTGLMLTGLVIAATEGQLSQNDANTTQVGQPLLEGDGLSSFIRGFFSHPAMGPQYAAQGGAGIAYVTGAHALLLNPAGLANTTKPEALFIKSTLPGNIPSFYLGYCGALTGSLQQGLGLQYTGDNLANEIVLENAFAMPLSFLGEWFEPIKAGLGAKIYLAQVGEGGNGLERSTGNSFGFGLDAGLQFPFTEQIEAGVFLRDGVSALVHHNTLTNQRYGEILPPEFSVGTSYKVTPQLTLLMDGQKALFVDQTDQIRLGGEQGLWQILFLRAGLVEVFGREAVQKLTVGFGIESSGFNNGFSQNNLSVNYSYALGFGEDQPLAQGHQFSLTLAF